MSEIDEVLKFNGLKCDHCGWEIKNIPYEEFEEWVNKPCPKCGESVLTQEDYQQVKKLVEVIDRGTEAYKNMSPEEREKWARNSSVKPGATGITFALKKGGGFNMRLQYEETESK